MMDGRMEGACSCDVDGGCDEGAAAAGEGDDAAHSLVGGGTVAGKGEAGDAVVGGTGVAVVDGLESVAMPRTLNMTPSWSSSARCRSKNLSCRNRISRLL